MPLTDGERRSLDEIERALQRDDPEFAATIDVDLMRQLQLRSLVIAAVSFLLGAVLLVTGLVTTHAHLPVGVVLASVGALIMIGTATLTLRRHQRIEL